MSRKARLTIGLILSLPFLAAGMVFLLIKPETFKPLLISRLNTALQRNTSIDQLELKLFPPGFTATNLLIADDPAFSPNSFLKAQSLNIRPSLIPLLSGDLEIESLHILKPEVELIQNQNGVWNVSSLGKKQNSSASERFTITRLNIESASVYVTRPDSPREKYSNLSAELRDYAEGKPFALNLTAQMPNGKSIAADGTITTGSGSTKLENVILTLDALKGKLNGEFSAQTLDLRLEIPKSPLTSVAPLFLPSGMNIKGDIAANVTARGTPRRPALNGRIDIAGFEVSGGTIKQPVHTGKLAIALTPERITLEPASITSGATSLQAFGVISRYDTQPALEATLIAPDAQIPELLAIARAYGISAVDGVTATGQAKLQVRAHGLLNNKTPLSYSGSGSLRNAILNLPSLTKPVEVTTADFRFEQNSALLTGIAAKLASSNITGDCRITNFSRPDISFNLASDKILIDELRTLFKDQTRGTTPGISADGSIKATTVQLAELTLSQLAAHASYRDGHLLLNPLTASLYGGRHNGSLNIDLRPAKPVYTMTSRLEQIESSALLAAATSLKGIVSGPFNSNLNLTFSPADPVQLARSLNGKVTLNFARGRIATFNLTNELAKVAQFLGFSTNEKFTQFAGLTGDLDIHNGLATTNNLKLDLSNMSASLTGNMNLADQTLDMKLISLLDRRFSEMVGGNKIGGFMSVALANSSGNLMIPASIRGTFANPIIAPDPAALAKLKLQSFNPKDPKQMMDSVNSVLDIFKKKKP